VKKNKKTIALVEWNDAWANGGWMKSIDHTPMVCVSLGEILNQDKAGLTLTSSRDENGTPGNVQFIPHGMIKKIKKVSI